MLHCIPQPHVGMQSILTCWQLQISVAQVSTFTRILSVPAQKLFVQLRVYKQRTVLHICAVSAGGCRATCLKSCSHASTVAQLPPPRTAAAWAHRVAMAPTPATGSQASASAGARGPPSSTSAAPRAAQAGSRQGPDDMVARLQAQQMGLRDVCCHRPAWRSGRQASPLQLH